MVCGEKFIVGMSVPLCNEISRVIPRRSQRGFEALVPATCSWQVGDSISGDGVPNATNKKASMMIFVVCYWIRFVFILQFVDFPQLLSMPGSRFPYVEEVDDSATLMDLAMHGAGGHFRLQAQAQRRP